MIKKTLLVCGMVCTAALLWYISPILKPFPTLTGSYHIGIETAYFTDQTRPEIFSENSLAHRMLVAHILYPTDSAHGKKNSYLGNKMPFFQRTVSDYLGIPLVLTDLLFRNVTTQSYLDAPLSLTQNKYPVVLFSHGLYGMPSDTYMVFLEELASHGYIVIGIDHPYFNILTLYPDDQMITSHMLAKQFETMKSHEQKKVQNGAISIYRADIQFMIDQIMLLNQNPQSIFYQRLDVDRIGVMGHSAGGTAAIELCRIDQRCKAAIDLDGWYDQAIGNEAITQPLLLVFGSKSVEVSEPTADYLKRKELTKKQYFDQQQKIEEHKKELCKHSNCSMVILPGVEHEDFGDFIFLKWPLRPWYDVNSYATIKRVNELISTFFDVHLKKINR